MHGVTGSARACLGGASQAKAANETRRGGSVAESAAGLGAIVGSTCAAGATGGAPATNTRGGREGERSGEEMSGDRRCSCHTRQEVLLPYTTGGAPAMHDRRCSCHTRQRCSCHEHDATYRTACVRNQACGCSMFYTPTLSDTDRPSLMLMIT